MEHKNSDRFATYLLFKSVGTRQKSILMTSQ